MDPNGGNIRRPIRPRQQLQPQPQQSTALKKPRLTTPAASATTITRATAMADSGGGGGAYEPQMQPYAELVSQYKAALAELTFNSKPIITNLTIIAGESLHAAKAIAFTICNHILEVPSEQKLPSLYLLDSIVKNIGRDYIKYFAARLPEVFCKAYRQVDPPVHASMRHLFGTWKGVFPLPCLHMIEKELGFSTAANGSSSGAATSKTNSQLQRAPSIHVNPKYLEKQGLQQPTKAKAIANIVTLPPANSAEDVERPDRAAVSGAKRSWADPRIKMLNSNREAVSGSATEQKLGVLYEELEYGSDVPKDSGLGLARAGGRTPGREHDKPWIGGGARVADALSGRRIGLNVKHGFSTPKSAAVDMHTVASRSSSGLSTNWRNSEEEEFLWERHSRISDQDLGHFSSNSNKDNWALDDSEKLDFDNIIPKPHILQEAVNLDTDTSSNSPSFEHMEQNNFGHRPPTSLKLLESHSSDLIPKGTSDILEGHSSFGRLTSNVGLTRTVVSYEEPQFPRKLLRPLNTQLVNSKKLQTEKLHDASSRPSSMQTQQHLLGQTSDNKQLEPSGQKLSWSALNSPLVAEASGHTNTKSLLSTVVNNGVLSNITSMRPPHEGVQDVSRKPTQQSSEQKSAGAKFPPHDSTSASSGSSEKKGKPILPPRSVKASKSVKKPDDPVSILLASLVEKGYISTSNLDTSRILPLQVPKQGKNPGVATPDSPPGPVQPDSLATQHSPPMDEVSSPEIDVKSSVILPSPTAGELENLIGLDLKPDVIRELHPSVISALSDDLPHQCGLCGLRLKVKEQLDRHMKWHAWKSSEPNAANRATRRWYPSSRDWAAGKAELPWGSQSYGSEEGFGTTMSSDKPVVIADEDHCLCLLCGDLFEDYYSLERKKWVFKAAMVLPLSSGDAETGSAKESGRGPFVHVDCVTESSVHDLGLATSIKMEMNA